MPDPFTILLAMVAACVVAASSVLLFGSFSPGQSSWTSFSSVLGVSLGGMAGVWILGLLPKVTLLEDRDRLLLILFPTLIVVEFFGVWFGKFAWALRWGVAAVAACVLLHNTIYLVDLSGPGSREWNSLQAWMILGGLAWGMIVAWTTLGKWTSSPFATGLPLVFVWTALGVAATIMLSGYASAGQLGFPLAAAILGSAFGIRMFDPNSNFMGIVGAGLLGVFSLLVMGRFLGSLTTTNAVLLFVAPMLAGPVILWPGRIATRKRRTLLMQIIAGIPIAVAVVLAYQDFVVASGTTGSEVSKISVTDYGNWSE